MSECKKYFEIGNQYVVVKKIHINDGQKPEYMYLVEWEFKNDYSFDENLYTFYRDSISHFDEKVEDLKNIRWKELECTK